MGFIERLRGTFLPNWNRSYLRLLDPTIHPPRENTLRDSWESLTVYRDGMIFTRLPSRNFGTGWQRTIGGRHLRRSIFYTGTVPMVHLDIRPLSRQDFVNSGGLGIPRERANILPPRYCLLEIHPPTVTITAHSSCVTHTMCYYVHSVLGGCSPRLIKTVVLLTKNQNPHPLEKHPPPEGGVPIITQLTLNNILIRNPSLLRPSTKNISTPQGCY